MIWTLMLVLALAAGVLAIGSHALFLLSLKRAHPDLWKTYHRVAYQGWQRRSSESALAAEVYAHITDERTRLLRRLMVWSLRLCAVVLFLAAASFALLHLE